MTSKTLSLIANGLSLVTILTMGKVVRDLRKENGLYREGLEWESKQSKVESKVSEVPAIYRLKGGERR
jgi:hypothetical protein